MDLGIDVGTSCVQAVSVDHLEVTVDQTSESLGVSHVAPFWSDQNPGDCWAAATSAVAKLPSERRRSDRLAAKRFAFRQLYSVLKSSFQENA